MMVKQFLVMYKYPGGSSGWSVFAYSAQEAAQKWEKEIRRGQSNYQLVEVQQK